MKFKRVMITAALALAMVVTLAPVNTAHGLTADELQQQINQLQAQLAQLEGTGTAATAEPTACISITFTRDLSRNSTGADVRCLQALLNQLNVQVASTGPGAPGTETTFFGDATLSAVQRYQTLNSISPAAGYVGPITRASLNANLGEIRANGSASTGTFPAGCTSNSGFSTTTGESCAAPSGLPAGCTSTAGYSPTTGVKCDSGSTLPAGCTSTAGYSPTTGVKCDGTTTTTTTTSATLQGGAGTISDADFVTGLNNEEVGEGENDVMIAGIDIEAGVDSDIMITALKLDFDQVAGTTSDFRKYASDVSVWFEGQEVARMNASAFDDSNAYTRTVSLDSGVIIRADQRGEVVVAVSGLTNIDSTDVGDEWTLTFAEVRFKDAQGAIITETSQGDIGAARTFSFESFATAANTKFRILSGEDSINDARVIDVDDVNQTQNVDVFSFQVRIEGSKRVQLKDLMISSTHTGSADDLGDIFSKLSLKMDGTEVGSESSSFVGNTNVVFNDIDTWIDPGTYDFVLAGDVKKIGTATFAEGDTVSFTIGETETDSANTDIEDANGDNLADADKVGTESSDAHAFFDNGIEITAFNDTGTKSVTLDGNDNDYIELVMNFDVHNFGDTTLYIPDVVTRTGNSTSSTTSAPTSTQGIGYHIQTSGSTTAGADDITAELTEADTDLVKKTNAYELKAGKTGTFKLLVRITNDNDPVLEGTSHRAFLAGVNWNTTDSATGSSVYTFDIADYKTSYQLIAN